LHEPACFQREIDEVDSMLRNDRSLESLSMQLYRLANASSLPMSMLTSKSPRLRSRKAHVSTHR
jgi:hypothetical protein